MRKKLFLLIFLISFINIKANDISNLIVKEDVIFNKNEKIYVNGVENVVQDKLILARTNVDWINEILIEKVSLYDEETIEEIKEFRKDEYDSLVNAIKSGEANYSNKFLEDTALTYLGKRKNLLFFFYDSFVSSDITFYVKYYVVLDVNKKKELEFDDIFKSSREKDKFLSIIYSKLGIKGESDLVKESFYFAPEGLKYLGIITGKGVVESHVNWEEADELLKEEYRKLYN